MSLVPVSNLVHARQTKSIVQLRAVLTELAHQADVLAEQGELGSLADGLANVRDLRRDFTDLERHIETLVAGLMPRDIVNLDDDVVLERHRGSKRRAVDWDGIKSDLRVATAVDADGVVLSPQERAERYAAALEQVAPLTASVSPRAGAMRGWGLNPDDRCETSPGRLSVKVSTREDDQ